MRLPLTLRIAWRYLFSKKSRGAVTAISTISVVGVAIATAAIVCVLSVFNGFQDIIAGRLDRLQPDVLVTPAKGKLIAGGDEVAEKIKSVEGVEIAMPVIQDNALAIYNAHEMPVQLKGVDERLYRQLTAIDSMMVTPTPFMLTDSLRGKQDLYYDPELQEYVDMGGDSRYLASISVGVAGRLGINEEDATIFLFAPRRTGRVNMANPISSFLRDSLPVSSVWLSQQSEIDKDMVITDIEVARRMFQLDDEVSRLEIKGDGTIASDKLAGKIREALGDGYIVKDRLEQMEVNFRMINIEKWVTFLLLAFILIIASFNIVSTLSMLVLEKKGSLTVFHSLGMTRRRIGAVFGWESVLVTLLGAVCGILLGVSLCLLQQHFGFIKLNGDPSTLVIREYPVVVKAFDIVLVLIPVALIGLLTAWISARFAKSRLALSNDAA